MELINSSETERNSALVAKSWHNKNKNGKVGSNGSTSQNGGYTLNSNVKNTKTNKVITCYRCKQIGHYRNQCPLSKEKTDKKQSKPFSVVVLSAKFSKSVDSGKAGKCRKYIDSGASMHMTANEE